jgi:MFS family permease
VVQPESEMRRAYLAAIAAAGFMIAFQVAAKATRDALFLSSFDVALLPRMIVASAVVSVLAAIVASRWMPRVGPGRLVPAAFATSAILLLLESWLAGRAPRATAIIVYLHYGALGAILISTFWSVVSERFDPRTAKTYVGRIAAGGTVGGLLGGILTERVGAYLSVSAMLPILAGVHMVCAVLVMLVRQHDASTESGGEREGWVETGLERSGVSIVWGTPYLRGMVLLVLLVTISEVLIDYVFKARATQTYGGGEALLRLFALFYTGVALLTVMIQAAASRPALQRLGLTRTVALLPASAAIGSVGAIIVPGLSSVMLARGTESVVRNGLYRAGYELLFTPVAREQKRAAKTLIDVGVMRLGDIVGSGLVQVALLLLVGVATRSLLGVAVFLSIAAVVVALRLRAGYVRTLEKSLLSRAIDLDLDEVQDAITRTAVLQSAATLGLTRVRPSVADAVASGEAETEDLTARAVPTDPELQRIIDLRSRSVARVRSALRAGPLELLHVPSVVPLLAWDDVLHDAVVALREVAPRVTGQLVDRLLDRSEEFVVRRRLPIVLASCPSERAVDGLLRGLEDPRFEVRYRCGRALNRLMELESNLAVERERAFAAVLREVAVDRGVWESHRLLDRMEDEAWSPVMDEVLRDRANRALEHVFTILALVLPRQPLKVAFRGLHTDDRLLRGTALEYLETALPERIKRSVWPFLEGSGKPQAPRRSSQEVLNDLLQSNQSIVLNLEQLRKLRDSSGQE